MMLIEAVYNATGWPIFLPVHDTGEGKIYVYVGEFGPEGVIRGATDVAWDLANEFWADECHDHIDDVPREEFDDGRLMITSYGKMAIVTGELTELKEWEEENTGHLCLVYAYPFGRKRKQ